MQYSPELLAHFFHPKNVGSFPETEQLIGRAVLGNYSNGVVVHFQLKVKDNVIIAAKFRAYGNVATIAACSFATEWLQNKSLNEAERFNHALIVQQLQIPEKKVHCTLLVEDAVKKAIAAYLKVRSHK